MDRTLQTFRYLIKGFTMMSVITFCCVVGAVLSSNIIYHLTDSYDGVRNVVAQTLPIEYTAAIIAWITGLVFFIMNFKVALANGISRKTYLIASLPAAGLMAAALAAFNVIVLVVHNLFWPAVLMIQVFHPSISLVGVWFVQFAQFLLLIVIGWFVTLAYYRSSMLMKWVISLAPAALFFLMININRQTNGRFFQSIIDFFSTLHGNGNPYQSSVMLLVYAAILTGLVYLLIRRAPLKG